MQKQLYEIREDLFYKEKHARGIHHSAPRYFKFLRIIRIERAKTDPENRDVPRRWLAEFRIADDLYASDVQPPPTFQLRTRLFLDTFPLSSAP